MESQVKTVNSDKVKKALELLEAARALQRDRITWGVDCIYRHVENVDGDWLERWGEDDEDELADETDSSSKPEQPQEYRPEEHCGLADVAAEIQNILLQLERTHPTNTTSGKMRLAAEVVRRIETKQILMNRIISAVKANGTQALVQLVDSPAASFLACAWEELSASI